ncbi:MAG: deoxyribodipyrimidine photolyase [Gemmataceae bacterium]
MTDFNAARVRPANDRPVNPAGEYVLYWCQLVRRLHGNHALDYAAGWAAKLNKPLVVYEGLKLNYPWASARLHTFVIQGMRDSAAAARKLGVSYWPFVETPDQPGRGLVRQIAAGACLVVTDDYPQFIGPAHVRAVAGLDVAVHAVDNNGLIPLARLGLPVAAAAHLRPRIHKLFAEAWANRPADTPDLPKSVRTPVEPPFKTWHPPKDIAGFVAGLPVDQFVTPVPGAEGGSAAGRRQLAAFVADKLGRYADERNQPDDPARSAASGLSWALHFGHVGIQEVAEAVLGPDWTPDELNLKTRNKDDFFCRDPNVNAFLDEAITWRDLGFHWHFARGQAAGGGRVSWQAGERMPSFNYDTFDYSPLPEGGTLARVLPEWAKATLARHAADPRPHLYTLEEFEHADTHDELWNAAQRELVASGRMHNYLRMLWGKKVLEWSRTPEEAYRTLEYLNNKYAIDGRDPNSYSGILWCFGLFDRPWPPDRAVTGTVRYMTSESTARKFKLGGYYEYVRSLPAPAGDRRPAGPAVLTPETPAGGGNPHRRS